MATEGMTELHLAAFRGKKNFVENILNDANPKEPEIDRLSKYEGRTALSYAADMGELDVVKFLISKHAAINLPCANKRTPLSYAASQGRVAVVETLLMHPAIDKNIIDGFQFTALDHAKLFKGRISESLVDAKKKKDDADKIIELLSK